MTSRLFPAAALDEVIREARHLLFAFDGPIRSAAAGNPPAPYIYDVLAACRESGRFAAIVTSTPPIEVRAYLDAHDLSTQIEIVAASVAQAVNTLDASSTDCVAITSSLSDTEAAQAARVPTIAYAKTREDAAHQQATTGATAVVYSMAELALRLRALIIDSQL